jgi:hypothetical protein
MQLTIRFCITYAHAFQALLVQSIDKEWNGNGKGNDTLTGSQPSRCMVTPAAIVKDTQTRYAGISCFTAAAIETVPKPLLCLTPARGAEAS